MCSSDLFPSHDKPERNKETTANKDTLNEEQTTKETASIKRNDLIINPQAGLVTVTKDAQTVRKVEEYLSTVMDRIHKQVLIDVQLVFGEQKIKYLF